MHQVKNKEATKKYSNSCEYLRDLDRRADGQTDGRTDRQTNGRYQTYYLPCFAVDKETTPPDKMPRA